MVPEVGRYVKAVYDFTAQHSRELSLQAGDIVKVTDVIDSNWLYGETVNGDAGSFPVNFVESVVLPDTRMGQRVYVALQDFPAEQSGELDLAKGDIILGSEAVDENWWRGKNGPLRGIFPLSVVHELEVFTEGPRSRSASLQCRSSSLKSRSDSVAANSDTLFARALADVVPQIEGELGFQIGDLITVKEIVDDDWLYGECHDKVGLVSTICVELLNDLRPESSSTSAGHWNGRNEEDANKHEGTGEVSSTQDVFPRHTSQHTLSYTSENTRSHDAEITPYAKTLYAFQAHTAKELSFSDNELVTLIQHMDEDWIEGELDGKMGLFPATFVEIIVDCPYAYKTTSSTPCHDNLSSNSNHIANKSIEQFSEPNFQNGEFNKTENHKTVMSPPHTSLGGSDLSSAAAERKNDAAAKASTQTSSGVEDLSLALVLHSFSREVEGDLTVNEGDTIEVLHIVDGQWLEARDDNGNIGLVPINHVQLICGAPSKSVNMPEATFSGGVPVSYDVKDSVRSSVKDTNMVSYNVKSESVCVHSASEESREAERSHLDVQSDTGQKTNQGIPAMSVLNSSSLSLSSFSSLPSSSSSSSSSAKTFVQLSRPVSVQVGAQEPTAPHAPQSLTRNKPVTLTKPKPAPKPLLKPKPALAPKPVLTSTQCSSASLTDTRFSSSVSVKKGEKVFSGVDLGLSLDNIVKAELEKVKSDGGRSWGGSIADEEKHSRSGSFSSTKSDDPSAATDTLRNDAIGSSLQKIEESSTCGLNWSGLGALGISSQRNMSNSTGDITQRLKQTGAFQTSYGESGLVPPSPTLNRSTSDSFFNTTADTSESKKLSKAQHRYSMPPARPVPPPPKDKRLSFVNQAFESDSEGHLIHVDRLSSQPPPPSRVVPQLPALGLSGSPEVDLLDSWEPKVKRPPPRPTGPRVASVPSRIPLQPTRAEDSNRPLPHRPAPAVPAPRRSVPPAPGQPHLPAPGQPHLPAPAAVPPSLPSAPSSAKPSRVPPRPASVALTTPPKRPPPRLQKSPADLMRFSPESVEDETEDAEIVADLKKRLQEIINDIQKYQQSKEEVETELARTSAEGGNCEEIKEKLLFVEETLQSLRDDEMRLKSNLFKVSPREEKLEKVRQLAEQRQADARLRQEEEAKNVAEERSKRCDKRQRVLLELIDTEKDYLYDLHLCLTTFFDNESAIKVPAGVDIAYLFFNMEEIADVSQRLLTSLESATSGKAFHDQVVGTAFIELAEDMKETYAPYCRHHDDVIAVLEKYREVPEACQYFAAKVEEMRQKTNIFDMEAMLIKPVQRILKYPLLLNELNKCTEEEHPDKTAINNAIRAMTDVATAINEYKRRKDLVFKYKRYSDQSFATKIGKLNLHSIRKKSSRMRGRLTTNLGIGLQLRDEKFEHEESRFRAAEKAVKVLLRNVMGNMEQMQELISCQENLAADISDYFGDKTCEEVTRYVTVHRNLMSHYRTLTDTVGELVIVPLNKLVAMMNGPNNVIEKRFDKLLDYNNMLGRGKEEKLVLAAKNDYEAMNAQLLDELPKLYDLFMTLMKHCMAAYVRAQRDFMDLALKENCILLELPSLLGGEENVMENFNIRHTAALDQISMLYFIPRGFNPRMDAYRLDRRSSSRLSLDTSKPTPTPIVQCSSQSDSQRAYLRQMYGADNLYQVTQTMPAQDLMDMATTAGTLVAVIKDRDPMGGRQRWYIDDGANKGFVQSSILQKDTPHSPSHSVTSVNDELDEVASECSADPAEDSAALPWLANQSPPPAYPQVTEVSNADVSPPPPYSYSPPSSQREFYVAEYPFQARSSNEVTIFGGQVLEVVCHHDMDGNPEWWLVDADGYRGYAPASYLRKTKQ